MLSVSQNGEVSAQLQTFTGQTITKQRWMDARHGEAVESTADFGAQQREGEVGDGMDVGGWMELDELEYHLRCTLFRHRQRGQPAGRYPRQLELRPPPEICGEMSTRPSRALIPIVQLFIDLSSTN
jgi:hypothetical protein